MDAPGRAGPSARLPGTAPGRSIPILAAMAAVLTSACTVAEPAAPASRAGTSPALGATAPGSAASAAALGAAPAARAFLSTLSASQRSAARFGFDDSARTAWAYVPQARSGIPLRDLDDRQRAAAFAVVGTGLSERGTALAHGIVELESTLQALERQTWNPWAPRRDAGLYFLSTFGPPDDTQPWGWRFEGHHLSVNVTQLGPHGQIVAPLFMGANPARVPTGPQQGLRLLAAEEDLAFALLHSLDADQRARAVLGDATFGDIVTRNDPVARPMAFAGLPAAAMTPPQQRQLRRLLDLYAGRMADSAAARQLQRIESAGIGRVHFAWAGAQQPGAPHYYRIHGPTVLVEYDNSQDEANHIHTVWRDLENDFGSDLLRRHYAGVASSGAGHAHE